MRAKLVVVIFALLFAIGFGAGGAFGIYHLYSEVNGWWQARSWQPVAATVLATQLQETATDDGTTYKATALYGYEVNGHRYNGTRVGVSIGSDNLGNWQRDHYLQLEAAQREGRTINVWVDPAQPERAVFDREIRWSTVALTVPFATMFPLVALGAFWVLLQGLSAPARSYNDAPKLEPNPAEIKSDARSSVRGLWLFATLWGLIAFPIAVVVVPEQFGHSWTWLLLMLFPLVGIGLIWAAIVRSLRLSRHGEVLIALQPAQPRLGESLAIKAHFRVEPPAGEYRLSLWCEKVDTRGDDTTYDTLWRQEKDVRNFGATLSAAFMPPASLAASEPRSTIYHRWRIALAFPDGKDVRNFDMAIGNASSAAAARISAEPQIISDAPARPVPERVATIVDELSRLQIRYNLAGTCGQSLGLCVFGLIFAGAGGFLMIGTGGAAAPIVMGVIFVAVGLLIVAAGLYQLFHRRTVEVVQGQLRVRNQWFFLAKQTEVPAETVSKLATRITGSSTSGNRRTDHYQVKVVLRDAREIVVASDIKDAGFVTTLVRLLQRHLKLGDPS